MHRGIGGRRERREGGDKPGQLAPAQDKVLLDDLEERRGDVVDEYSRRQILEEDDRDERQVVSH